MNIFQQKIIAQNIVSDRPSWFPNFYDSFSLWWLGHFCLWTA